MNSKKISRIEKILSSKNQDSHRLKDLKPLATLNPFAVQAIKTFCATSNDRAVQAVGVLLYALISNEKSVAIVSSNDMDKLLVKAAYLLPNGQHFSIRSKRGPSTIYAQMFAILIKNELAALLKKSVGKVPGIIEIIDDEWLGSGLLPEVNDEMRLQVINSTSNKIKYSTYAEYVHSNNNSTLTSHPIPTSITILTSHSEPHNEQQISQPEVEKAKDTNEVTNVPKSASSNIQQAIPEKTPAAAKPTQKILWRKKGNFSESQNQIEVDEFEPTIPIVVAPSNEAMVGYFVNKCWETYGDECNKRNVDFAWMDEYFNIDFQKLDPDSKNVVSMELKDYLNSNYSKESRTWIFATARILKATDL